MSNYLIDFVDTATDIEISEYLSVNNCLIIKEFNNFHKVYLVESSIVPPNSTLITSIINDDTSSISLLSTVDLVRKTFDSIEIDTEDQKHWWKIYSCNNVDLSSSTININIHKTDNVVYLFDSGIDINHPEFNGRRIELLYSVTGTDFTDISGHGTALASVITGNTCSINDSIVKVVKIFDGTGVIKTSSLVGAFDAVITDFIAGPAIFAIANLSWAIERNTYIEEKIQQLINFNVNVIVASGNSGIPIQNVTPAAMKDVVTVGSYNESFMPSNFSNYGDSVITLSNGETNYGELDGWAPGEKIWVAMPGGGYGYSAGTSLSAATHTAICMYNTDRLLEGYNFGTVINLTSTGISFNTVSSFLRTGLLDLTDPKYANSPNRISTFINEPPPVDYVTVDTPSKIIVRVGSVGATRIFSTVLSSQYELLTTLPGWCHIDGEYLIAAPNIEPNSSTGVEVFDILFRIVPVNGLTFDKLISVVVMSSTFNRDVLPEDDPLHITLLADTCTGTSTPCGGKVCPVGLLCYDVKGNCECSY